MKDEEKDKHAAPSSHDLSVHLNQKTHCARLGHLVPFSYCLNPAQDTPCFKILDCWWQSFDVVSCLESHLPEDVFQELVEKRNLPNRLNSILQIMNDLKNKK